MAIITISRTWYSGGEEIAEAIASRLDYPCLRRKELILGAAEDFHFPEATLVEAMEEPPKLWQQDRDKRDAHFNLIRAAFLKRCHENEQNLIYHGFSGQELIRRVAHVLRVLVIADETRRVEAAMHQLGVGWELAHEQIVKSDKKFSEWTRHMYGYDWQNPALYDLVIHIGRFSVESAVAIILKTIEDGDFDPTEDSRQAFADELLASLVWSALTQNEETSAAYLETTARGGVVTISGTARSKRVFEAIPRVAQSVQGVADVKNEVNIGTIWRS